MNVYELKRVRAHNTQDIGTSVIFLIESQSVSKYLN